MAIEENLGPAFEENKVNEVSKNVQSADDLLKLAQAKQIFATLERRDKKLFPWESVLKLSSVAVGAFVGAALLLMGGITDNFTDAYNFAKEAKSAKEHELAEANRALKTATEELDSARANLKTLEGQLRVAEASKLAAEADRRTALQQEEAANNQRALALADVEKAGARLADLEAEVELAQISSIRMYLCDQSFAKMVFDRLSDYHGWQDFSRAVVNVFSSDVYLSVQFIGDGSFQYVANLRSRDRLIDTRTEFGRWSAVLTSVNIEYTMSKRDRPTQSIEDETFPRGPLAAYARGDTDGVCSESGTCFHRNSTCRPEVE